MTNEGDVQRSRISRLALNFLPITAGVVRGARGAKWKVHAVKPHGVVRVTDAGLSGRLTPRV